MEKNKQGPGGVKQHCTGTTHLQAIAGKQENRTLMTGEDPTRSTEPNASTTSPSKCFPLGESKSQLGLFSCNLCCGH